MRLIDADKLELDAEWSEYEDGYIAYSQIQIDTAPTIDIVFCAECKHYIDHRCRHENSNMNDWRSEEDFCSYGERIDK